MAIILIPNYLSGQNCNYSNIIIKIRNENFQGISSDIKNLEEEYRKKQYTDSIFLCELLQAEYLIKTKKYDLAWDIIQRLKESETKKENRIKLTITESLLYSEREDYRQALKVLPEVNNSAVQYKKANAYLSLHVLDSAKKFIIKAINLQDNNQIDKGLHKRLLGEYYYSINDYDSSIFQLNKSVVCFKKNLECNKLNLAFTYKNFISVHTENKEYDKALKYFNKAEQLLQDFETSNYMIYGLIYMNKAIIHQYMNDNKKALVYYNKTLNILEENADKSTMLINIHRNIASIYFNDKEYKKALEYYKKCAFLMDKHNINSQKYKAITYSSLAATNQQLGNLKKADNYYTKALDIYNSKLKHDERRAYNHIKYGFFLSRKLKNNKKALEFYKKAINIYIKYHGLKNCNTAYAFNRLGMFYFINKDYSKAIENYKKAINVILYKEDEKIITDLKNVYDLYYYKNFIKNLAWAYYKYYQKNNDIKNLVKSNKCYKKLDEIIEKENNDISFIESKLSYASKNCKYYKRAADAAYELYKLKSADNYKNDCYNYSVKAKSMSLYSSIKGLLDKIKTGIPSSYIRKENKLKSKIAYFTKQTSNLKRKKNINKSLINTLEDSLFYYTDKSEKLFEKYNKEFPKYYNLKYKFENSNPEEIKKILNKNEALIEYLIHDTLLYIFIITSEKYSVKRFSNPDIIKANYKKFIVELNNYSPGSHRKENYLNYSKSAYNLYKLLLGHSEKTINKKRLIIIPDAFLSYIPFGALITKKPDSKKVDYKNLSYLIKTNPVSYKYSSRNIFIKEKKQEKNKYNILAFAPEYDNYNLKNDNIETPDPLFWNSEEIDRISEIFKTKKLKGAEATKDAFLDYANRYKILHLAMHAFINDKNPDLSYLLFSKNNDKAGKLNIYELYNYIINAELVVLTGCNTGFGKYSTGEGVMSLARGFSYAGCSGIIMSLWPVVDVDSPKIINIFYNQLNEEKSKDEALQIAKIEFLKNANIRKSHPYYWAGYVNLGNNEKITIEKKPAINHRIYLLIFIAVTTLLLSIYLIRKKLRN